MRGSTQRAVAVNAPRLRLEGLEQACPDRQSIREALMSWELES